MIVKVFTGERSVRLSLLFGILAGACLAGAAYFRATFYSVKYVFPIAFLIFVIYGLVHFYKHSSLNRTHPYFTGLILVLASFATFISFTNPWLNYVEHEIRGVRNWSTFGDSFISGIWATRSEQPDFIRNGGIGWACELDKTQCREVQSLNSNPETSLATRELLTRGIKVVLNNPVGYLSDQLRFNGKAFISSEYSGVGSIRQIPLAVLMFLTILITVWLLIKNLGILWPAGVILLGFYGILFIPNLIGHIEVRYMMPFKLIVLLYPFLASTNSVARKRQ